MFIDFASVIKSTKRSCVACCLNSEKINDWVFLSGSICVNSWLRLVLFLEWFEFWSESLDPLELMTDACHACIFIIDDDDCFAEMREKIKDEKSKSAFFFVKQGHV